MTWLLLACTWPEPEASDTSAVPGGGGGCRLDHLSEQDPGDLSVLEWTLDGLPLLATPEELCASESQVDIGLRLEDGEAWVTVSAEPGVYNLPGDDALIGVLYESLRWTEDFYLGTLRLDEEGGALQGEALAADGQLTLDLAWSASF